MPYKFQRTKAKIPRELDRRVKITPEDRANILTMYNFERLAVREIVRRFNNRISRRSIDYICKPEKLEHAKALYKERRKDGRYYDKEKATVYARLHRRYKQSIKDNLVA